MPNIIRTGGGTVTPPDTNTYLYKLGDECNALTGGWVVQKGAVKNTDNINIGNANPLWQNGSANGYRTVNTVNLTNFTKLKVLYTSISNLTGDPCINASTTTNFGTDNVGFADFSTGTDVIEEINVTALNSAYYIGGYVTWYSPTTNATIKKIWLEA